MRFGSRPCGATGLAALGLCLAASLSSAQTPAPAPSAATRTVELILDASGSMHGRLASGQVKIEAARSAVEKFLAALPDGVLLAFRAYGHQSPREKHDCSDTQLIVPFSDVSAVRGDVTAKARALKAQGYTPITRVIETAAKDFPAGNTGARSIVLVSDGKETCDGDPCTTARALQKSGAGVVIHTVGFDVDKAARAQLRCVAEATGGTYFDAPDADQLAAVIAKAAVQTATKIDVEAKGNGWLQVKGAELSGHVVVDAATGAEAGKISATGTTIGLAAGLYNVKFGESWWKSVEVKAKETTVLEPGVLVVEGASFRGHRVLDSETGISHGSASSMDRSVTLMPGTYDVTFGPLVWSGVRVDGGQTVTLKPGSLSVKGLDIRTTPVKTADGRDAGGVSATSSTLVLPPGSYQILIGGKWQPFTLAEGQQIEMAIK